MKIDIKGILEGITNSVFKKEEVEAVAQERLEICRRCEFNSKNAEARGEQIFRSDEHCLSCGCNLYLKTRAMSAQCPLDPPNWESLATDEESQIILKELNKLAKNENKGK